MIKCPKCGTENPDSTNFCKYCRHNIGNVEITTENSSTRKLIIVGIIIAIILASGAVAIALSSQSQNNHALANNSTPIQNDVKTVKNTQDDMDDTIEIPKENTTNNTVNVTRKNTTSNVKVNQSLPGSYDDAVGGLTFAIPEGFSQIYSNVTTMEGEYENVTIHGNLKVYSDDSGRLIGISVISLDGNITLNDEIVSKYLTESGYKMKKATINGILGYSYTCNDNEIGLSYGFSYIKGGKIVDVSASAKSLVNELVN